MKATLVFIPLVLAAGTCNASTTLAHDSTKHGVKSLPKIDRKANPDRMPVVGKETHNIDRMPIVGQKQKKGVAKSEKKKAKPLSK